MPDRLCLKIGIGRMRIELHPESSEVDVECILQGSGTTNVWRIVMHVNICQVILGVVIS